MSPTRRHCHDVSGTRPRHDTGQQSTDGPSCIARRSSLVSRSWLSACCARGHEETTKRPQAPPRSPDHPVRHARRDGAGPRWRLEHHVLAAATDHVRQDPLRRDIAGGFAGSPPVTSSWDLRRRPRGPTTPLPLRAIVRSQREPWPGWCDGRWMFLACMFKGQAR